MDEVDFFFSRPSSSPTSSYVYEVGRGTRSVSASFGRALDELWTRDEVGQRNSEMRLLATHASIAPRNPQHPARTREPALP
jgi:hypothetical protein